MNLLSQLMQTYKTLSIVGMAKNSGKTTTLNYLIEEAMDDGIVLGVTSTGRDGESTDLITGTEKPRVYLSAGTIVTIPRKLYELADAGLEIISLTNHYTALGQIMLCKVAESGYVQIAGPVNAEAQKEICEEMFTCGVELILIDGAVDRRSIAAPDYSDAVILSTGAVLSRSMKRVVEETALTVRLYQLPELENSKAKDLIFLKKIQNNKPEKVIVIKGNKAELLDLSTGLLAGKFLDEAIDEKTDYIYMPGALTNSVISEIHPSKFRRVQFIVNDPTKIFTDVISWQQLEKKGVKVKVLKKINVAGLTVNPYSPAGYSFEREALLTAMRNAVEGIPVIDVKMGGKIH
ncbi:MAG: hypothetical protein ACOX4V_06910 [Anaerovoracaceae bacterium]|jgi:hypothetical protein|nr:hypothetical protein [Clostridiales bacterium]